MRILLAHITQNRGGVEKRFLGYAKFILSQNDHQYDVLISRSFLHGLDHGIICSSGNRLIKYGFAWDKKNKFTRYIDYIYLTIVLLFCNRKSYDIVHFPTTTSLIFRNLVQAEKKVYSVVTSESKGLMNMLCSQRFSQIMKERYIIDCLDTRIREKIVNRFPDNTDRVFASPCSFIDYNHTKPDFNMKENTICFVGRLLDFKGIDLLLKVIPGIIEKTSFRVLILGRGEFESEIRELIDKFHWQSKVTLSYSTNPKKELKKSKIFLSLQRDENYPSQSLLEAMACGNSIIATNVGLTHLIVKNDFGVLIDDEQQLLEAIVAYSQESADSLKEKGEKARCFALSSHTVERFHDYLISIYEN